MLGKGLVVLAFLVAAGCSDDHRRSNDPADSGDAAGNDAEQTNRYANVGAVCFSPRAAGGTTIHVVMNACESVCAELRASCSLTIVDGTIELVAQGAATLDSSVETCRAECQPLIATCNVPELSAGMHGLEYGERTAMVSLPVTSARTEALPGMNAGDCDVVPDAE